MTCSSLSWSSSVMMHRPFPISQFPTLRHLRQRQLDRRLIDFVEQQQQKPWHEVEEQQHQPHPPPTPPTSTESDSVCSLRLTTSMILRRWATHGKPNFATPTLVTHPVLRKTLHPQLLACYHAGTLVNSSSTASSSNASSSSCSKVALSNKSRSLSTSLSSLRDVQSTHGRSAQKGTSTSSSMYTAETAGQEGASTSTIRNIQQDDLRATPNIPFVNEPVSNSPSASSSSPPLPKSPVIRENIYTLPNLLTVSRIISCPFLGYFIVKGNFVAATGLLFYAGISDLVDGWLARRFNMGTVFGSILDPAADKALMTTLTIALAVRGLLPVPLAILILGRDVALSISAFYFRYISLPEPKTFKRYWDFSIPSAEVRPTQISKLVLMGVTTVSPLLPYNMLYPLQTLQVIVAGTTIWSGLSYVGGRQGLRILSQAKDAVKKS